MRTDNGGRGTGTALGDFFRTEAAGGIVLLATTAVALLWANSPFAHHYHALWHTPLAIGAGGYAGTLSLELGINDGLMTVFFLVVGLEIRRGMHDGVLADPRAAALPLVAACGGVAAPALIFLLLNGQDPALRPGWAVPTATDIAFAVGILALLGRRVSSGTRMLLLAIAVIDDVIAIAVIAFFFSSGLSPVGLLVAAAGVGLVILLQRMGVKSAWFYVAPGAVLWMGLLWCGIHPALAGVVLGLMTPVDPDRWGLLGRGPASAHAPVERVQRALHPWVAFGVMPLFALANAGVDLRQLDLGDAAARSLAIGVAVALVAGKLIGIFGASLLAVRTRLCRLPEGTGWPQVLLVALLGGIGFTMAIFIASLAFDSMLLLDAAKSGILVASAIAAVVGLLYGRLVLRQPA